MSGGYFDYVQSRIAHAAEEVKRLSEICKNEDAHELSFRRNYSPQTLQRFQECEETLRKAAAMLYRVDWLVCGDDSEESFNAYWDKEISSNEGKDLK